MRLPATSLAISAFALALSSATAHADTSAWASLSAGPSVLSHDGGEATLRAAMAFDAGVGTSPKEPLVFGGLFRISPTIEEGTDLSLVARGASGSSAALAPFASCVSTASVASSTASTTSLPVDSSSTPIDAIDSSSAPHANRTAGLTTRLSHERMPFASVASMASGMTM